jgi:glyoxylase-like metal-dependent hydrolase (beta-lactamase superfamily II)
MSAVIIRADNPGPMTLAGTNTILVGDPARGPVVVIDPGPDDDRHLRRVLAAAGSIAAIVITHRHLDHTAGSPTLAALAGCDVLAADPAVRIGDRGLVDGDRLSVPGAELRLVATPGHTSDSYSILITGDDGSVRLATGDMVLGRGTTVIMHPDGDVGSYLASLEIMIALVRDHGVTEILPGHGPVVTDPAGVLAYYRQHRLERLDQVRAAVAAGARTRAEVVRAVYTDIDEAVRPAAELSAAAQLAYLERRTPLTPSG